jgi:hypothetical protein
VPPTKANAPIVAIHFAIRIASRGELVELQNPLETMIFIAEDRIEFIEWKDDKALLLQSSTNLSDQVFWGKVLRLHGRHILIRHGPINGRGFFF